MYLTREASVIPFFRIVRCHFCRLSFRSDERSRATISDDGSKSGYADDAVGRVGLLNYVEKAQSMLFRFREAQAAERGLVNTTQERRPRAVFSVTSVPNAEKWRAQIVREVSRRVTKIQDRM